MLESQTVKVGTAVGSIVVVLSALGAMYAWADKQHEKADAKVSKNGEVVAELRTSNKLLTQIVTEQKELIKRATENAQKNRESLIRIEAKLETQ